MEVLQIYRHKKLAKLSQKRKSVPSDQTFKQNI